MLLAGAPAVGSPAASPYMYCLHAECAQRWCASDLKPINHWLRPQPSSGCQCEVHSLVAVWMTRNRIGPLYFWHAMQLLWKECSGVQY